jgi:hypothetical protein
MAAKSSGYKPVWQIRTKHGRGRAFADHEDLRAACIEYFDWVHANPLYEAKVASFQGKHQIIEVPKPRAMTLTGLRLYIGVGETTWTRWEQGQHADFKQICLFAREVIEDNNFVGAASDFFNAQLISRQLGLADKTDHTSSDGSMSPPSTVERVFYKPGELPEEGGEG